MPQNCPVFIPCGIPSFVLSRNLPKYAGYITWYVPRYMPSYIPRYVASYIPRYVPSIGGREGRERGPAFDKPDRSPHFPGLFTSLIVIRIECFESNSYYSIESIHSNFDFLIAEKVPGAGEDFCKRREIQIAKKSI